MMPGAAQQAAFRFASWGESVEQAVHERVVAKFEATHDGIFVVVNYTAGQGDYYRKITTDFAWAIHRTSS